MNDHRTIEMKKKEECQRKEEEEEEEERKEKVSVDVERRKSHGM